MIYAFDTYYYPDFAYTVCLAFESWTDEKETFIFTEKTAVAPAYESGAFYKRELPCILSLLEKIDLKPGDVIVVDGYVTLDDNGKTGLGGYLYEALKKQVPVVGIAKNELAAPDSKRKAICRGESKTPLFLTTAGTEPESMVGNIKNMHGNFRIPSLLKRLDQLTRLRSTE